MNSSTLVKNPEMGLFQVLNIFDRCLRMSKQQQSTHMPLFFPEWWQWQSPLLNLLEVPTFSCFAFCLRNRCSVWKVASALVSVVKRGVNFFSEKKKEFLLDCGVQIFASQRKKNRFTILLTCSAFDHLHAAVKKVGLLCWATDSSGTVKN